MRVSLSKRQVWYKKAGPISPIKIDVDSHHFWYKTPATPAGRPSRGKARP